jgi:hypothetical protein
LVVAYFMLDKVWYLWKGERLKLHPDTTGLEDTKMCQT